MRAASSSDGYSQLPQSFWAAGHLKDEKCIAWLIARVICFNKCFEKKKQTGMVTVSCIVASRFWRFLLPAVVRVLNPRCVINVLKTGLPNFIYQCQKRGLFLRNWCQGGNTYILVVNRKS